MGYRKTVFVIEPDHDLRVEIRRILEDADHFVISATNGKDALGMLEKISAPTLILLNPNMPFLSGEDFLAEIHKDEKYRSIPVIQISDGKSDQLPGACRVIAKSLKRTELLKAVEDC